MYPNSMKFFTNQLNSTLPWIAELHEALRSSSISSSALLTVAIFFSMLTYIQNKLVSERRHLLIHKTSYLSIVIIAKKLCFLQSKLQNLVNNWCIVEVSTWSTGDISTVYFLTQKSVPSMLHDRTIAWTIQSNNPWPIFNGSIFISLMLGGCIYQKWKKI